MTTTKTAKIPVTCYEPGWHGANNDRDILDLRYVSVYITRDEEQGGWRTDYCLRAKMRMVIGRRSDLLGEAKREVREVLARHLELDEITDDIDALAACLRTQIEEVRIAMAREQWAGL